MVEFTTGHGLIYHGAWPHLLWGMAEFTTEFTRTCSGRRLRDEVDERLVVGDVRPAPEATESE